MKTTESDLLCKSLEHSAIDRRGNELLNYHTVETNGVMSHECPGWPIL